MEFEKKGPKVNTIEGRFHSFHWELGDKKGLWEGIEKL